MAFATDALRPSSLPSASLGRIQQTESAASGSNQQKELQKAYDEWNKRIDTEVQGLSSGLQELVDLANIGDKPSSHAHATTSLNLQLRTSQIIRGVQNLRDITHDLKLSLLLSDQISTTQRRDHEIRQVRADIERKRREVGETLVRLKYADSPAMADSEGAHEGTKGNLGEEGENDERAKDEEDMQGEVPAESSPEPIDRPGEPNVEDAAPPTIQQPPTANGAESDDEEMEEV